MTLRGEIESFALETIVQLVASTSKTGQLEVNGPFASGTLGFDGGRLVAASAASDVGEVALGSVFANQTGSFEFVPWTDPPAANLSGSLDQLMDRALAERDRILAIRDKIPDDRLRFRLSERAAQQGEVTLTSEQWRVLLAVNGERDVPAVAEHLHVGRLAALGTLARLVEAAIIDVVEPPSAPPEPPSAPPEPPRQEWSVSGGGSSSPPTWEAAPAAPAWERPAPVAPQWEPPAPEPPRQWEPPAAEPPQPTTTWEAPAPSAPAEWSRPEPDLRADLAAALDARMSALEMPAPPAAPEVPPPPSPVDIPPVQSDERLAALSGVFGPPHPASPPAPPTPAPDYIAEWSRPSLTAPPSAPVEEKKKGRFGFLKREEKAAPAGETIGVESRAGVLAALSNALLAEYNGGHYGKGRIDDRMANLLMRVDEQADPIDRPLPIVDDRIDVQALDREGLPDEQAVPYLAMLVTQVYDDAERTFGKDKAKKGYKAAQQQVLGGDASVLASPDLAGRLPKV